MFMYGTIWSNIFPIHQRLPLLYLRYTDDVFTISKGTKEQLITVINKLNKNHKTIKSEYEISSQKIPFLDTMVCKGKEK